MAYNTREFVNHTLYSTSAALTAGFTSDVISRNFMSGYCIAAKTTINTTTSSVIYALQASIENTDYVYIPGSTSTVSVTGLTMWDVEMPNYNYVRVIATATTANFNVTITARSVEL